MRKQKFCAAFFIVFMFPSIACAINTQYIKGDKLELLAIFSDYKFKFFTTDGNLLFDFVPTDPATINSFDMRWQKKEILVCHTNRITIISLLDLSENDIYHGSNITSLDVAHNSNKVTFIEDGDVIIFDLDEFDRVNITNTPSLTEASPNWSFDDTQILYHFTGIGYIKAPVRYNIPDSSAVNLLNINYTNGPVKFSNNSYDYAQDSYTSIFIRNTNSNYDNETSKNLNTSRVQSFCWAPDDQSIAFVKNNELWIYKFDPEGVTKIPNIQISKNSISWGILPIFSSEVGDRIYISANPITKFDKYSLYLISDFGSVEWPLVTDKWIVVNNSVGTISDNILSALQNGRIEISTSYQDETYKKGIFLYKNFEDMEIEPNNTKDTAYQMNDGAFDTGDFYTGDVDYYRLNTSSDSVIDIGYLSYSNSADMRIEVFDSDEALMASGVSSNGEPLTFTLGLTAGTYYLKLSSAGDVDQVNSYVVTYKILGALPAKNPITLNMGGSGQDTINQLEDESNFTFTLGEKQGIRILFTPTGGSSTYHVELLNSNQTVVDQIMCPNQGPVSLEAVFAPDDYILRVTPVDNVDASSPFTVQLTKSTSQLEEEPNNIYKAATIFDTEEPITGRLSSNSDMDFYTFDLASPRYLELSFSCPGSNKDFYITLYKESDQNLIDGITVLNSDDISLHMGLGIGKYYLKISGDGSNADTINYYTLSIGESMHTNLEIESNNTLRFANAIEKDSARNGRIFSSSDIDFYGFHLSEPAIFSVGFTPSTTTGDYLISLVDENNQMFNMRYSTNGEAHIINANKEPGNYYIKVESNGDVDQYSQYELSVTSDAGIVGLKQLVSVTVAGTQVEMSLNETQNLTATAGYSDATSELITTPIWTSLDDSVATVNAAGLVTAVAEGSTSIVASYGGLTGKFDLVVGAPAQTFAQHYGNLILVAGGGAEATNTLKESTQYLSDLVYRRFRQRLFTDDDIYYFNPVSWHDIDGDGYDNNVVDDDSPTVAEFGQTMTGWAATQSTDGPLYIYLIDHGGIDSFKIFPNEILTANQLNGLLGEFQQATDRRVVVMIEACKSGSFKDNLIAPGIDRIVVTSTDEQDAYLQLAGRISFTQLFVDRLLTGDSIYQGWLKAKSDLSNMGLPYSLMAPQLEQGIATAAAQTMLGGDFGIAGLSPAITGQSPSGTIDAHDPQTLYVVLSSLEGIDAVWAVVLPPDYVPPAASQDLEAPVVGLPTVDLTDPDRDGRFEGNYSDFTQNGNYRVTFYARNDNGNVTVSTATILSVTGGQPTDTDADGMPDAWEEQYPGLDKNLNDATGDIDSDGLDNLGEYQNNTDPTDSDTDDDNLPDGWEVDHGLDANQAADALQDADSDGVSNYQEYVDGTDPQDDTDFIAPVKNYQLTGRVITSIPGWKAGVKGAVITLQGTEQTANSSQDGSFTLNDVPEGAYELSIAATYFKQHTQQVTVTGGDLDLGDIELEIIACDVNGDGRIGLEEAIQALQAISDTR